MSSMLSRLLGGASGEAPDPDAPSDVKLRVLMVCMGNICRSPTAEAVLRHRLAQAGLGDLVADHSGVNAHEAHGRRLRLWHRLCLS